MEQARAHFADSTFLKTTAGVSDTAKSAVLLTSDSARMWTATVVNQTAGAAPNQVAQFPESAIVALADRRDHYRVTEDGLGWERLAGMLASHQLAEPISSPTDWRTTLPSPRFCPIGARRAMPANP